MLQYPLDPTQSLDHVRAVVVKVPQLPVMTLVCPPERVLLQHLVLLEVGPDPPAFVVGQCVAVLLEQGVDTRNATIPRVFQVLQSQSAILGVGLLSLEAVLGPNPLTVNKLTLPRLDVPEEGHQESDKVPTTGVARYAGLTDTSWG